MNKRQICIGILSILLFGNCLSVLPREQRRTEAVFTTQLTKKEIYDRALVYLAKSLVNANLSVQIRDPENGRIVSNGKLKYQSGLQCLYSCDLEFNIDLTAKDGKYRIILDDILMYGNNQYGQRTGIIKPYSEKELASIKEEFLIPLQKELVDSIEGRFMAPQEDF